MGSTIEEVPDAWIVSPAAPPSPLPPEPAVWTLISYIHFSNLSEPFLAHFGFQHLDPDGGRCLQKWSI